MMSYFSLLIVDKFQSSDNLFDKKAGLNED